VFASLVNFALFPVYTAFLSPADYGNLALLQLFGVAAKIAFRLGLDSGFFRVYYDLRTDAERRSLAGTVAAFSAAFATLLFLAVVLAARPLTHLLFRGAPPPAGWVVLTALDVYVGCFAFVPLGLLRIQDRAGLFSSLAAVRHATNAGLKVLLLARGWGVAGALWSDAGATALFSLALLPILLAQARGPFSMAMLREALSFGLPKVPHGVMVQVQNLADRKVLDLFVSRAELGLYHVGYTFGSMVKFASTAFEPAWQPFVYAQLGRPEAKTTLARTATQTFALFTGAALGIAVLGPELLALMTPARPEFRAAAPVIPVVALAYLLHGVFLLTSIGIGLEKKAGYYPLITAAAAATNLAVDFTLIPILGMIGAAWATVASYFVMAALGAVIAHRVHPLPFERGRFALVAGVAALVFALSRLAPAALVPAVVFKAALLALFPAVVLLARRHARRH
jgi:O-antigen/teichoic acid export membrane protein